MQEQAMVRPKTSADYIRQPDMYKLVRSKEDALDAYLANKEQYGEEHFKTKMKFMLYVLRANLIQIKETIADVKEIVSDFAAISQEIESLFEIDFGANVKQFVRNIEKYPKFMRNYIARRRAKKYYANKMAKLRGQLIGVQVGVEAVSGFLGLTMDCMMGLCASFNNVFDSTKGKNGKKGGNSFMSPEIAAEIARAEQARGSSGSVQAQAPTSTSTASDARTGSTGSVSLADDFGE